MSSVAWAAVAFMIFLTGGGIYILATDNIPANLKGSPSQRNKVRRLAEAVWPDDRRLAPLLEAWDRGDFTAGRAGELRSHVRNLAEEQFEEAARRKGTRIMPNLFYRRGKLALEKKELDRAEKEFQAALEATGKHTYRKVREELTVRCHYALGLVAWNRADWEEARRWLRKAEEEQASFGGRWVPEIRRHRERLDQIIQKKGGGRTDN